MASSASSTDTRNPTAISVEPFQPDQILYSAYQRSSEETLTKIRFNNIPNSFEERVHLRALIVRTRSDLDLCSDPITRLQILKTLELQESLLTPIRTLPSEILIEIFNLVTEMGYPKISYISSETPKKLRGTIFPLTWVCARWRKEALLRAAFWSRIYVDLPGHRSLCSVQVLEFMQECIMRSGSCVPMDVTIVMRYNSNGIPSAHVNVLDTLVNRGNRWRSLKLHGFTSGVDHKILHLFDAELARSGSESLFPLLEELSIQFPFDGNIIQNRLASVLYYIPPLQKLEVSTLFETDTASLDTLTILKVGIYAGHSLAGLLRKCPLLEDLKVDSFVASRVHTPPPDTQGFSHPILSVLGLGDRFDCGAWSSIYLPNLTRLTVTPVGLMVDAIDWERDFEPETQLSELKEMLERSKCTLERIDLYLNAQELSTSIALKVARTFSRVFLGARFGKTSKRIDSMDWIDWMTNQESCQRKRAFDTLR